MYYYPPEVKTKDEKIEYLEIELHKPKKNPYEVACIIMFVVIPIVLGILITTIIDYSKQTKVAKCETSAYQDELDSLKTDIELALTHSSYGDIVRDVKDITIDEAPGYYCSSE